MSEVASGRSERERFETVVVGAGQAGLSVGYHLARRDLPFVILDANERIGDSWRKRWDSLRLFTPARYNALPGMAFPGPAHSFSSKDEVADYLEAYAEQFELPVRTGVRVDRLSRNGRGSWSTRAIGASRLRTSSWRWQATAPPGASVRARARPGHCPAPFPRVPEPVAAPRGSVVVVGVGNSGAEIAIEVVKEHPTRLAGRETGHVPFRTEGAFARFVFLPLMFRFIGHRVLTVRTPIGRRMRPKLLSHGAPLVRVKPKTSPPQASNAFLASSARGTGCRCSRTTVSSRRRTSSGAPGSAPTSPGSTCLSSARRMNRSSPSIAAGSSPKHPGCTSSGCSSSTRCRPGSSPASEGTRSTS